MEKRTDAARGPGFRGPFFHDTKADVRPGDLLRPGHRSNFGERGTANYVYLTAALDAATWGAELSAAWDQVGRPWERSAAWA